jgi:hypothetical protein
VFWILGSLCDNNRKKPFGIMGFQTASGFSPDSPGNKRARMWMRLLLTELFMKFIIVDNPYILISSIGEVLKSGIV